MVTFEGILLASYMGCCAVELPHDQWNYEPGRVLVWVGQYNLDTVFELQEQ